jgi:hypothetical protein
VALAETVVRETLARDADVEFLSDREVLSAHGGLAAWLRW